MSLWTSSWALPELGRAPDGSSLNSELQPSQLQDKVSPRTILFGKEQSRVLVGKGEQVSVVTSPTWLTLGSLPIPTLKVN